MAKRLNKYIRRTRDKITTYYELVEEWPNNELIYSKKYKGKFTHIKVNDKNYLYREVSGVTPDILKKNGCVTVERFIELICRASTQQRFELVKHLDKKQLKAVILKITRDKEDVYKNKPYLVDLCIEKIFYLSQ